MSERTMLNKHSSFFVGVFVGAEAWWRAVAGREAAAALPALGSHQQYRERLLAPGLFPPAVIRKALVVSVSRYQ